MESSGDRLKAARISAGFDSARKAALRYGWNPSTYASHENGQTPEVPPIAATMYARAFKVSRSWIITGDGASVGIDEMLKNAPQDVQRKARDIVEILLRTGM